MGGVTAGRLVRTRANEMQMFVQLLQSELPQLDEEQCCFVIEKNRESTARIVGWRHLGISNSYTLEMSLAGSNQRQQVSVQISL